MQAASHTDKVPKRVIVIDELPTSAAGKILRSASRHLAEQVDAAEW